MVKEEKDIPKVMGREKAKEKGKVVRKERAGQPKDGEKERETMVIVHPPSIVKQRRRLSGRQQDGTPWWVRRLEIGDVRWTVNVWVRASIPSRRTAWRQDVHEVMSALTPQTAVCQDGEYKVRPINRLRVRRRGRTSLWHPCALSVAYAQPSMNSVYTSAISPPVRWREALPYVQAA